MRLRRLFPEFGVGKIVELDEDEGASISQQS